jgi:hypothetical protein
MFRTAYRPFQTAFICRNAITVHPRISPIAGIITMLILYWLVLFFTLAHLAYSRKPSSIYAAVYTEAQDLGILQGSYACFYF